MGRSPNGTFLTEFHARSQLAARLPPEFRSGSVLFPCEATTFAAPAAPQDEARLLDDQDSVRQDHAARQDGQDRRDAAQTNHGVPLFVGHWRHEEPVSQLVQHPVVFEPLQPRKHVPVIAGNSVFEER